MTPDPNAPADTQMMGIVHQAMRRDLERARAALTGTPAPDDRQRAAIAAHVRWVMAFLKAHHASEDTGLYPVVRARRPEAAPLLAAMSSDHEAIAVAVADVEAATSASSGGDLCDDRLVAALEQLETVLLPHLRREEDEVMPFVSSVITNEEWSQIEREHNLAGKSLAQLGREGHWLIDDARPEDRDAVLGLVPPIPRFVLVHGYARSYRRYAARCWNPPARRRVQKQGRVETVVEAPIDAVWDVVRDVARVGEWSHECAGISWLGDASSAVPGARFRGRNHQGIIRWGRVCEILAAAPYEIAWRTVPTALYPDSTVWTIRLRELDAGTAIEQTFEVVRAPKLLDAVYALAVPAHRDRNAALTDDLARLGGLATAQAASADPQSPLRAPV